LSILFCLTGLAVVLCMAKLFHLDKGFASGLLSGGLTQSSVIGTATDAIGRLSLDPALKDELAHHVPLADAVTYLFGTIWPAIFLSKLAPRLLGVSVQAECEKMEEELEGGQDAKSPGTFDSYVAVDLQAFRLEREQSGQTVGALEKSLPDRTF